MNADGKRVVAAVLAVAACSGIAACGAGADVPAKTESQSFPFAGDTVRIEVAEAAVRVEEGPGDAVEVRRELFGKAAGEGNASWSMAGDTLKLRSHCSGLTLECDAKYTVAVPKGAGIRMVASGSRITLAAVAGDVDASLSDDGSLQATGPAGRLNLVSAGGAITVADARSADVTAKTTGDGSIRLAFAAAPRSVKASASGSVEVTLPNDASTYRVKGADSGSLASDSRSSRSVNVAAADGTARVRRAG